MAIAISEPNFVIDLSLGDEVVGMAMRRRWRGRSEQKREEKESKYRDDKGICGQLLKSVRIYKNNKSNKWPLLAKLQNKWIFNAKRQSVIYHKNYNVKINFKKKHYNLRNTINKYYYYNLGIFDLNIRF